MRNIELKKMDVLKTLKCKNRVSKANAGAIPTFVPYSGTQQMYKQLTISCLSNGVK